MANKSRPRSGRSAKLKREVERRTPDWGQVSKVAEEQREPGPLEQYEGDLEDRFQEALKSARDWHGTELP